MTEEQKDILFGNIAFLIESEGPHETLRFITTVFVDALVLATQLDGKDPNNGVEVIYEDVDASPTTRRSILVSPPVVVQ